MAQPRVEHSSVQPRTEPLCAFCPCPPSAGYPSRLDLPDDVLHFLRRGGVMPEKGTAAHRSSGVVADRSATARSEVFCPGQIAISWFGIFFAGRSWHHLAGSSPRLGPPP